MAWILKYLNWIPIVTEVKAQQEIGIVSVYICPISGYKVITEKKKASRGLLLFFDGDDFNLSYSLQQFRKFTIIKVCLKVQ